MLLKILGALFIITACGSVGFKMAIDYRKEEDTLRHLIEILNYSTCELAYRLTPLPELCRQIGIQFSNLLGKVFVSLAIEIEKQESTDIVCCMLCVLNK